MINSVEDLRSAGTLPSGPVSAWPKARNVAGDAMKKQARPEPTKKIRANLRTMAGGLAGAVAQGIKHGKASPEVREARYSICKKCPSFIPDSKRCSECGCFMQAKTWIAGNPAQLCPLNKWEA